MTHQEHAHDDDSTLGRLYRQLKRVAALREQMRAHPEDQQDRDRLRQWQADRLGEPIVICWRVTAMALPPSSS